MKKNKCLLVISNMFPDKKHPFYGTFVKNFCEQLNLINVKYDLSVMKKNDMLINKIISYILFYTKTFFKCLSGGYERVYIHYASHSSLPVLFASKFRKLRILVNVHGSDVFPLKKSHAVMNGMTEKIIKKSEKVIVPSEYFKKVIIEKYSYPKDNIVIYPSGGINAQLFYEYSDEKKSELKVIHGLNPNLPYIGFVSRMSKEKGWDVYIKATEIVIKKGYKCGFIMVGSGPDDELLLKMINDLKLQNFVKIYPQKPQKLLPDYYNMMEVFVFPTVAAESLGLVAIEAMGCGCPVVGSDYAAPGTYIVDGENGFKFPKGDYNALAYCIEKYLNFDDNTKQRMKYNAKETASQYDSKKIINILQQQLL